MPLTELNRLVLKTVLETTVDQIAIVGGTLPSATTHDGQALVHPNISDRPLEELLLKEKKIILVKHKKTFTKNLCR